MSHYTVKYYTGDYGVRQADANKDKAICYVCQHANSKVYDDPQTLNDNPILTVVAHNASYASKRWASYYSGLVKQIPFMQGAPLFKQDGIGLRTVINQRDERLFGVLQRRKFERGDFNLRKTDMPAILPEPCWVSDFETANELASPSETLIADLGRALAESIIEFFPEGGLVAFSVGHKYKTSQPYDRGAPFNKDAGNPNKWAEGEVAEAILDEAAQILRAYGGGGAEMGGTPILNLKAEIRAKDKKITTLKELILELEGDFAIMKLGCKVALDRIKDLN